MVVIRMATTYPKIRSVGSKGHDTATTMLFHGAVAKVLLGGFDLTGTIATVWTYGKHDGIYAAAAGVLVSVRPSRVQAQGDKPFEEILPMAIGGTDKKRDFRIDEDFASYFFTTAPLPSGVLAPRTFFSVAHIKRAPQVTVPSPR